MEILPGPQDGGEVIRQNNGRLCSPVLSLSQDFSATSASSASTYEALHSKNENLPSAHLLLCFFLQSG